MKIGLEGLNALVTGGSKGIGLAIAREFAKAGAKVTIVSRDEALLKKSCDSLSGSGHSWLALDFSKPEEALKELETFSQTQKIDILINNTGGPPAGPIETAEWESFNNALQMHLRISHSLAKMVIPNMREKRYGRIINVISTSIKIPIPGLGVSNTVRGAMASWAKTLSFEVAKDGITVNNILPGFINTGRLSSIISVKAGNQKMSEEEVTEQLLSWIPAGRFGEPEELGKYATFLASEHASYITGTSLQIDGGRTGSL